MTIFEDIQQQTNTLLGQKHALRESVLPRTRSTIQDCSKSIRAIHRKEFDAARSLLEHAQTTLSAIRLDLADHPDLFYNGPLLDAQKEFAEAMSTLALITHQPMPFAVELGIEITAYLNGIGETIGELRRYTLNEMRLSNFPEAEYLLACMDEIFTIITALDYPDSLTGNLRRTADVARGIIEKTRGELTTALIQSHLSEQLTTLQTIIQNTTRPLSTGDQFYG